MKSGGTEGTRLAGERPGGAEGGQRAARHRPPARLPSREGPVLGPWPPRPSEFSRVRPQEGNGRDELRPLFFLRISLFYSEDRITVCKHLKVIREARSLSGADARTC